MKPLGPDEGINALQHSDCRACKERERLSLGQVAEIKALKAKLAPVEAERDRFKAERDLLLTAIGRHAKAIAPVLHPDFEELANINEGLYEIADRIRAASTQQQSQGGGR